MKIKIIAGVMLASGFVSLVNVAHSSEAEIGMIFRGTLIEPSACTINDGNRVEVNFGDRLGVNKVDGVNYRQAINYQIVCENSSNSSALTLSLSGSAASFDSNALQSSKENLAIRVYQNDVPFVPGSTLKIDLASPPRLEAVPVKNPGSTLTEGAFEAWATLRADYQ